MCMFWDFLGSVFVLHGQIMLALHSYYSIHMQSFEFRGLFHASGAIFSCFGTMHRVSMLEITCLYAIFHPLPCFGRVAFYALGSVLGMRARVHAFRLSLFHLMSTDVSVAEVHSCWYKSIVNCICHFNL